MKTDYVNKKHYAENLCAFNSQLKLNLHSAAGFIVGMFVRICFPSQEAISASKFTNITYLTNLAWVVLYDYIFIFFCLNFFQMGPFPALARCTLLSFIMW